MRKIFNLTLVSLILLSTLLPHANAHEGSTRIMDIAKDCEFMYVLKGSDIQKLSLPNLTVIKLVSLPVGTRGNNITIAGGCSDPNETILVFARARGPSNRILLSYNENLDLIAQLTISDSRHDDDDDDEHDDNHD